MTGPVGSRVKQEHQGRRVGVLGHFLDGQGQAEDARARAPELDRQAQPEEPGVAERLEDVLGVGALLVDGPGPWLDLVLGQAPDRIAELQQLVGKIKMHR